MPSKRRVRWRIVVLSIFLGTGLGLLGLGCAATCRPGWYQPAAINWDRLKDDKRDFSRILNDISGALNGQRTIDLELREDQINRWITARTEIPQDWLPIQEIEFHPFSCPQVTFLDGNRLRVAALLEQSGWKAVVSIIFRMELKQNEFVLDGESINLGALPIPYSWVAGFVQNLPQAARAEHLELKNVHFPNEGVWYNGKRRFRITHLEISQGIVRLRLEPLLDRP